MGKRLTVIIPGYNTREEWWRRCVESVRKACGPEDEIICVDDGSKVSVQKSWVGADVDERVRLIRKENGGLASARNAGMEAMRGKYVTFVDSDDEVRPETFERCIKALEANDADVAVYGVKVIWVEENLCKVDKLQSKFYGKLTSQGMQELVQARLFNYACNKVYSVDLITGVKSAWNKKISFEADGMPCEDAIFNLSCARAGARFCTVDYPGYIYYRTGNTLLSTYTKTLLAGCNKNSHLWDEYCRETGVDPKPYRGWAILSEGQLNKKEWGNIWRKGSPYGLLARYIWLKEHSNSMGVRHVAAEWLKALVLSLCERYLYIRPIRRYRYKKYFGSKVKNWR